MDESSSCISLNRRPTRVVVIECAPENWTQSVPGDATLGRTSGAKPLACLRTSWSRQGIGASKSDLHPQRDGNEPDPGRFPVQFQPSSPPAKPRGSEPWTRPAAGPDTRFAAL